MAIEAFAGGIRRLDESRPPVPGGPVVRAEAPAGGPVWIVTDPELAREVLADPRIGKDPALAPPAWDPHSAGLEPPPPRNRPSPPSTATPTRPCGAPTRRCSRRDACRNGRTGSPASPGTCSRSGPSHPAPSISSPGSAPTTRSRSCAISSGCRSTGSPTPPRRAGACTIPIRPRPGAAMGAFMELAAAAVASGGGLAVELRDRLPAGMTADDLHYQLFALLFAGPAHHRRGRRPPRRAPARPRAAHRTGRRPRARRAAAPSAGAVHAVALHHHRDGPGRRRAARRGARARRHRGHHRTRARRARVRRGPALLHRRAARARGADRAGGGAAHRLPAGPARRPVRASCAARTARASSAAGSSNCPCSCGDSTATGWSQQS